MLLDLHAYYFGTFYYSRKDPKHVFLLITIQLHSPKPFILEHFTFSPGKFFLLICFIP